MLDRDFTRDREELTPKGSYRRKQIAANFAAVIDESVPQRPAHLALARPRRRVPHWLIRDLGVLEDAIQVTAGRRARRESRPRLAVAPGRAPAGAVGDLEYGLADATRRSTSASWRASRCCGSAIRPWRPSARQGRLGPRPRQRARPGDAARPRRRGQASTSPLPQSGRTRACNILDDLCRRALFGPPESRLAALTEVEARLPQALAARGPPAAPPSRGPGQPSRGGNPLPGLPDPHPRPARTGVRPLPPGLPALGQDLPVADSRSSTSPRSRFESRRLQRFRQRLHLYRTRLDWPASEAVRRLFSDLLHLLADFGALPRRLLPHGAARTRLLDRLRPRPRAGGGRPAPPARTRRLVRADAVVHAVPPPRDWTAMLSFQEGMTAAEIARLTGVLGGPRLPAGIRGAGLRRDPRSRRDPRRRHLGQPHLCPAAALALPGQHQHHRRQPLRPAAHPAGRSRRPRGHAHLPLGASPCARIRRARPWCRASAACGPTSAPCRSPSRATSACGNASGCTPPATPRVRSTAPAGASSWSPAWPRC